MKNVDPQMSACDEKYNKCSHICVPLPIDKILMSPDTAVHIVAPRIYYSCDCPNGYSLNSDGFKCEDLNECAIFNGGCHSFCINTIGKKKIIILMVKCLQKS